MFVVGTYPYLPVVKITGLVPSFVDLTIDYLLSSHHIDSLYYVMKKDRHE
jgi:hypothetical protein